MRDRVNELISHGVGAEDAINMGMRELSGELPTALTPIEKLVAPTVREALFQQVYRVLADDVFEMTSTAEALRNALLGRAIPRDPGTKGGSAYSRLLHVFGQEITETITQRQTLEEVIAFETRRGLGLTPPTGPKSPFIEYPPDRAFGEPSTARLIPEENLLASPQSPLRLESPGTPFEPRPPDLRSPTQKELDLLRFRGLIRGDTPPTMPFREYPPDNVVRQLRNIPDPDKSRMLGWAKALGLNAMDLANLLRANIASFDISYLRQQAFLIPGHLIEFAKSFKDALRAVWSKEYAEAIDASIRKGADYQAYEQLGLEFLRPLNTTLRAGSEYLREENYIVLGGQRPLQKLANKIPWINISARAFITGANSMNWHIWKGHLRMLSRMNEQAAAGLVKLPDNFSVMKSAEKFGNMLEDMSGRARLGPLKELTPALNAGFFSARLNIGRLISPRHLFSSDKFTRQAAWKNFTTAIGTYSSIIFAGKMTGLWDVELDPRSSDFMKIRIGNTRVDIWGGYQQYVVLYARLLPVVGGLKSISKGTVSDYDPIEGTGRFLRTKVSPAISQVLTQWTAKDFKGSKIDRRDWKRWLHENLPITVQDVLEAFQNEGLVGLKYTGPSLVGMGVQVHQDEMWAEDTKAYFDIETDPLERQAKGIEVTRDSYRKANPEIDAKLFITGHVTSLKGLNTSQNKARLAVLRLVRENNINPTDIRAVQEYQDEVKKRKRLGLGSGERTLANDVIQQLLGPEFAGKTPSTTTSPLAEVDEIRNQRNREARQTPWQVISAELNPPLLRALAKCWKGGSLTGNEEQGLRAVYEKHPYGAPSFSAWYRQTCRQWQSNDANSREPVLR